MFRLVAVLIAVMFAVCSLSISPVLAQTKTITVVGPMFIDRLFGDTTTHNVVKELMDAGAMASIQTDQSSEQAKSFREYGSFLIRHGLKEQQALEALTINGARAMMLYVECHAMIALAPLQPHRIRPPYRLLDRWQPAHCGLAG